MNHLKINTYQLHYGEEPVLSGSAGSGTIFFSHCNMRCVFCQNYQISALGSGRVVSSEQFIKMIYELRDRGANNINLVSPTPYTDLLIPILEEIKPHIEIPFIWNSNAFESVEQIKRLEGLIDIYLPDFKYWDDDIAYKYSGVRNYREHAQGAISEMFRQTGKLLIDDGIAFFGMMIRLLVLPNNLNGTEHILNWINSTLGNQVYISLMSQYYPAYQANNYPELSRGITADEYENALNTMYALGFENGFVQQPAATPEWTPEFNM